MTIKTQLTKSISRGFTLVELLISLAIIMLMIVAASGIEVRYMGVAGEVKHNLVAQDLAESRMNMVRKIRDTNIITNNPDVFNNISDCMDSAGCSFNSAGELERITDAPSIAETQLVNGVDYTITVYVSDE